MKRAPPWQLAPVVAALFFVAPAAAQQGTQQSAQQSAQQNAQAESSPASAVSDGADADFAAWLAAPQRCERLPPSLGERPLALEMALRAVVCRSGSVRQGSGLAMQAQAALDRALGQRQPALNLSTGFDRSRGAGAAFNAELRVDWVLYDFGVADAATRQARHALLAVMDEQRGEVLAAVAQGAQLFAAAQAALGRLDAAAQNLGTAQENARAAVARYGAGAATLSDKLQAETAVAQNKLEHARVSSQWLAARGTLALAMGLAAAWPLVLPPADTAQPALPAAPHLEQLLDEARANHPRIIAARSRWSEAQSRASSIDAERWGSVSAGARAGRSRASSADVVSATSSVGVEWSLPLWFDRGVLRSRMKDALGQVQVRAVGIEEAERQVASQVWQEGQALIAEIDGLRASREVLDTAEAALRVASERFRQGAGGFRDVLAAQSNAANARFQWVESRANLARAQWRLAAAVGRFGTALTP